MYSIKNNKGMGAMATSIAITSNDKVGFLTIAGAQTAVKAIWASVINTRTPLYVQGPELKRGKKIKGDDELQYVVEKFRLRPALHHWVIIPDYLPDSAFYLLLPMEGKSKEELLVNLLRRHTLWPVRDYDTAPEWGDKLFVRGLETEAIIPIDTYGELDWAYEVSRLGWDGIIDNLAKNGLLTFPE